MPSPASEDAESEITLAGNYRLHEIGGLTFCEWPEKGPAVTSGLPSLTFYIVMAVSCLGVVGLSLGAIHLIFANPDLGGKVVGYGAVAFMTLTVLITLLAQLFMLKRPAPSGDKRPESIPRTALPVRATVGSVSSEGRIGRPDNGWLWIDRNWLIFRGHKFGFNLQASDFKSRQGPKLFVEFALLKLPKDFPGMKVFIKPRRLLEGEFSEGWTIAKRWEYELDAWAQAAQTGEARLYPPITFESDLAPLSRIFLAWLPNGLICGGAFVLFAHYVPPGLISITEPGGFAFGCIAAFMIPSAHLLTHFSRKAHAAMLKKADQRALDSEPSGQ